jgi:hypothetical protein
MVSAARGRAIVQIAYVVDDIRASALQHSRLFGSGPFFIAEHIPIHAYRHRGAEQTFDHSAAFGQWGDLMVEFAQQHNDAPSHIHDLYPVHAGRTGIHHIAMFVQSLEQSMEDFERAGLEVIATGAGPEFRAAFVDATAVHGHMLEIYERDPGLVRLFDLVKSSAASWNGIIDPIRDISM